MPHTQSHINLLGINGNYRTTGYKKNYKKHDNQMEKQCRKLIANPNPND